MEPPENHAPSSSPPPYAAPPVMEQPAAPPPYAPSPYGPPAAAPRRGRGGLVAIIAIVLVVILIGGGYLVGGFLVAQGELNSATDSYNSAVDHQNKLDDLFNKLSNQINGIDFNNATADNVSQAKTLYQQLATQSQSSEPQVVSDDASLASADSKLKQNAWLTAIMSGSLQTASKRIGYLRAGLAVAKTILDDYQQFGTFNVTLLDAINDVLTLTAAADKNDLAGASAAVKTLESDIAKGIPEDKAPGLSPNMDAFMHDFQNLGTDFDQLLTAAIHGDQTGVKAATTKLDADSKKVDAYDFTAMDNYSKTFFQNLVDSYNKQIHLANQT